MNIQNILNENVSSDLIQKLTSNDIDLLLKELHSTYRKEDVNFPSMSDFFIENFTKTQFDNLLILLSNSTENQKMEHIKTLFKSKFDPTQEERHLWINTHKYALNKIFQTTIEKIKDEYVS